jgi:hypothetical protein
VIQEKAEKAPSENADLLETLQVHVDKVSEKIEELTKKHDLLMKVDENIETFSQMIGSHTSNDLKEIGNLLKENKEIKESIFRTRQDIDSLDGEIDDIALFIDDHASMVKKKYKAKKGDEVDELLADLLNHTNKDVQIKRVGEGKYMIGDKKINAKVVNGKLLVRIGGGYTTMQEYMENFGQAQLDRSARKSKRENRGKARKQKKPRVSKNSRKSLVVGSAELMKSMK